MLPNACYRFTTQQWLLGSAVVAARDFGHNRAWLGLSATIGTFSSSRQRFRLTQACLRYAATTVILCRPTGRPSRAHSCQSCSSNGAPNAAHKQSEANQPW